MMRKIEIQQACRTAIAVMWGIMQDLLKPEHGDLALRENAGGVFVEGAMEEQVSSATDCLELLQLGDRNR